MKPAESPVRWALLVGCVVLAGFALRLYHASGAWLNPDECLQYMYADHAGIVETIKDSNHNAHPPLLVLLIHFWRRFGDGEAFLRLLSVVPSSLAIVLLGLWVRAIGGAAAGLLAAGLFALSPHLAMNGAELRQYSLLLLGLTGALYSLEMALTTGRASWIAVFGGFQLIAIWSHFSAMWAVASIGAYSLFRLFTRANSVRLRLAWALAEAAGAASYALLWFMQLQQLLETNRLSNAASTWMAGAHFQPQTQSIAWFTVRSTGALLAYVFSNPWCGALAAALVAAGFVVLVRQRRYALAVLLGLPWAIVYGGSVFRLAAYGGSRHSLVLLPFLLAAAGIGGAVLTRSRSSFAVAILLAAAPYWPSRPGVGALLIPREEQAQHHMKAMLAKIRELAPAGSVLIGDGAAKTILGYYLGRADDTSFVDEGAVEAGRFSGYKIISIRRWALKADELAGLLPQFKVDSRSAGATLLCVSGGWEAPLCARLAKERPDLVRAGPWTFGRNLAVAELARPHE